jgi:hypothetical protein
MMSLVEENKRLKDDVNKLRSENDGLKVFIYLIFKIERS